MTIPSQFAANRSPGRSGMGLQNSARQRSPFPATLAAVDNDVPNGTAAIDLDSLPTARLYGNDADVVELDKESDNDSLDNELQMTGAQRAKKKQKLVVIPRVLDPSKKGVHVKRFGGPMLQPGTVVEFADGTFM